MEGGRVSRRVFFVIPPRFVIRLDPSSRREAGIQANCDWI
jgi:hypothetical protein